MRELLRIRTVPVLSENSLKNQFGGLHNGLRRLSVNFQTWAIPSCPPMNRKLDMRTIRRIREMYATGQYKQLHLAFLFGVSAAQISRIINKKRRQVR
jgi:hypothetical protein